MADHDEDEIERAREQGAAVAGESAAQAPEDPLLRVAWSAGFGSVDQLAAAVEAARAVKLTWHAIAAAIGESPETTRSKYGPSRDRHAAYMRRRRAANPEGKDL